MVRYVSKEQALDNPLRQQLLGLVETTPGINMKALAETLACQPSTVIWHAAMLQRAGLLRTEKVAGLRVFYLPNGTAVRNRGIETALLHHDAARKIHEYVSRNPGATFARLAQDLLINASALRWHVRRLVDGGVVCLDRQGRLAILYPGNEPGRPCRRSGGVAVTA